MQHFSDADDERRSDPLFSAVVSLTTNAFTSSCCMQINVEKKYVIQITVELCTVQQQDTCKLHSGVPRIDH